MASYSGLQQYAFISYAHKDSKTVTDIISRLTAKGARLWYDENLLPADEYVEVIAEKIEKSSLFIAFISKSSLASKFCRDEIRFAYESEKPMMVVYLDDEEPSAGVKMMIGGVQAIKKGVSIKNCVEGMFERLPSCVVNTSGIAIRNSDEYSFFYSEHTKYECRFQITRQKYGSPTPEVLVEEKFPTCSELLGYQLITRRGYAGAIILQVSVRWDFTYTNSGRDDDYFEETYEYVFRGIDSEKCTVTKKTVERYDINTGIITTYDYVQGLATDTSRSGEVLSIHGIDAFGNYWRVEGKRD